MEWFGLDKTLKIIAFHPTCHGQWYLPPDQVAENIIQAGFEHFPRMSSTSVVVFNPVDFCPSEWKSRGEDGIKKLKAKNLLQKKKNAGNVEKKVWEKNG